MHVSRSFPTWIDSGIGDPRVIRDILETEARAEGYTKADDILAFVLTAATELKREADQVMAIKAAS